MNICTIIMFIKRQVISRNAFASAETATRKAGDIIERAQCQNGKTGKRRNGKRNTAETDGTTMLTRGK